MRFGVWQGQTSRMKIDHQAGSTLASVTAEFQKSTLVGWVHGPEFTIRQIKLPAGNQLGELHPAGHATVRLEWAVGCNRGTSACNANQSFGQVRKQRPIGRWFVSPLPFTFHKKSVKSTCRLLGCQRHLPSSIQRLSFAAGSACPLIHPYGGLASTRPSHKSLSGCQGDAGRLVRAACSMPHR